VALYSLVTTGCSCSVDCLMAVRYSEPAVHLASGTPEPHPVMSRESVPEPRSPATAFGVGSESLRLPARHNTDTWNRQRRTRDIRESESMREITSPVSTADVAIVHRVCSGQWNRIHAGFATQNCRERSVRLYNYSSQSAARCMLQVTS
jgi:hypothetical protein